MKSSPTAAPTRANNIPSLSSPTAQTASSGTTKIPRAEFKSVIKECLKELIAEGALNNTIAGLLNNQGIPMNVGNPMMGNQFGQNPNGMMTPTDPRVQVLAQSMGRAGNDSKLFEAIFQDSINTEMHQNSNDPQRAFQNGGMGMETMGMQQQYNSMNGMNNGMMDMSGMPQMMNQGYYGNPMQQQMQMPQQQNNGNAMMLHQQAQQQIAQQTAGAPGGISRWAQLAFNSKIKNRPASDSEGGLGFTDAGPAGVGFGKFG